MSKTQQIEYKGYTIEVRESQPDPYEIPTYYWKVLKDGTNYGDNSKGFGESTGTFAEDQAKRLVDELIADDVLTGYEREHRESLEKARQSIAEAKEQLAKDLAAIPDAYKQKLNDCVLFSFSHGFITEGCGKDLLGCDRLEFRDRWIAFLRANPEIAKATGWENWLTEN